jgi:hypothetical protein
MFLIVLLNILVKPSKKNQMEQTLIEVDAYFRQINEEFRINGKNIEWICPKNFMFL